MGGEKDFTVSIYYLNFKQPGLIISCRTPGQSLVFYQTILGSLVFYQSLLGSLVV